MSLARPPEEARTAGEAKGSSLRVTPTPPHGPRAGDDAPPGPPPQGAGASRSAWRAARMQERLDALAAQATPFTPIRAGQGEALTAGQMGLLCCHRCNAVWSQAQEGERCARCGSTLHVRKPHSIQRTWALLIAAVLMYLPANLLPVMITKSLFGTQQDTILSGVIFFWISGSYGLAALIFTASFLVPLFKLAALFVLVAMAQRGSDWRLRERSRLYHLLEFIGRWSMLDVFVVALLAGLVQIKGFAVVQAGVGIAAFGAVVVLTMLASLSFDPRLTWDKPLRQSAPSAP